MNIHPRKFWALPISLALVASAGITGVALATGADDWYTGTNTTIADPDNVGSLVFYNATGEAITTGSAATAPFASYVVPSVTFPGADHTSLFLYKGDAALAPGAWTGVQIGGTVADATVPGSSADNAKLVYGAATGTSLTSAASSFTVPNGTYQVRLRPSSAAGVSTSYASAFVKVEGSTWTQVSGLGSEATTTTTAVAVTTAPGATAGTSLTLQATVDPKAAGTVQFKVNGSNVGAPQAVDGTTGKATYVYPTTAAGTLTITAAFTPQDDGAFTASTSTAVTYVVGTAGPSAHDQQLAAAQAALDQATSALATATQALNAAATPKTVKAYVKALAAQAKAQAKVTAAQAKSKAAKTSSAKKKAKKALAKVKKSLSKAKTATKKAKKKAGSAAKKYDNALAVQKAAQSTQAAKAAALAAAKAS